MLELEGPMLMSMFSKLRLLRYTFLLSKLVLCLKYIFEKLHKLER